MTETIIARPSKNIAEVLRPIFDYYEEKTKKLIYFLYSKGFTVTEIANVLGVTKQAISQNYPKRKGVNHEQV